MAFDLSDYVDVAERIRMFYAKYPDGSLQSEITIMPTGVLCKAYAHREPGDACPAIGHAFEPIPGKTPYTKDSEVMNAETSAWGRAIVAAGFETKKIASRDEVQNRSEPAPQKPQFQQPKREPTKTDAEADKLTGTLVQLAKDLGAEAATRESIRKNLSANDLDAHKAWLKRQITTATKNLEQKVSAAA